MPTMQPEQLKQDLLVRWERAFDEIDLLEQYKNHICTEKYIPGFRYDVQDFGTPRFLHPDGKFFPEARARELKDYHFYGFAADGMPCYTSFGSWQGFYSYSEDLVEYVEFCIETGIPSCIKRLHFLDGNKIAYQYLLVQGRGSSPVYKEMDRADIIEDIEYSLIYRVERYLRENGRVSGAEGLLLLPGTGSTHFRDVYRYDDLGRLDEIRTWFDDGSSHLTFARLSEGTDIAALSDLVATQLAEAITDTLTDGHSSPPLSLLEISYHQQSVAMPVIIPRTAAFTEDITRRHSDEDVFDLIFLSTDNVQERVAIRHEKFERSYRQFMQIVEREDKWELAAAMFKKAALKLTTLHTTLPATDEFAAYAVDWEFDMEDFEEVLRDCGVNVKTIALWKERGWL
jgi:hypothetical protein